MTASPNGGGDVDVLVAAHLGFARDIARLVFGRPARRQWLDEAEGVAADALVKAARRFDPARAEFGAWVSVVVRDALRELLGRRARQAARRPRVSHLAEEPAARPDPPPVVLPGEYLALVTPGQRAVLHMRFVLGMTFREIAAARGTSKAHAHRQLVRAVRTIRRNLRVTR